MVILPLILLLSTASEAQGSVAQLFDTAVQEQKEGKPAEAIRDYREILRRQPGMFEARVNLGAMLADSGKYDEAIAMYQSALPLTSSPKAVQMNIARAYYMKGDLAGARSELEQVHHLDPADQAVALRLANVCLEAKLPAEAVALLEPLDSANSTNMDFQILYGSALITDGRPEEGVRRVEAAATATHRPEAYLLAGKTHLQYAHPYEARDDLEAAFRLNPQLPNIQILVGMARENTGDDRGAEEVFKQILQNAPDDFQANLHLGTIYYRRRLLDQATKYLERSLQLQPQEPNAIYMMGMLKSVGGDYPAAVAYLEQVAKQLPDWAAPHLELAKLYYRLHRAEDGLRQRRLADELASQPRPQPLDAHPTP